MTAELDKHRKKIYEEYGVPKSYLSEFQKEIERQAKADRDKDIKSAIKWFKEELNEMILVNDDGDRACVKKTILNLIDEAFKKYLGCE